MTAGTDIKLKTLSYVILYVPDTKEATTFYTEKLGFKVKMEEQGWVELESGPTTIALHESEPGMKLACEKTLAPVLVFKVENIKEAFEALKNKGIQFSQEAPQEVCATTDHVGFSADFTDPFGNKLSIYGETKK
ncbi:MAG: VOC family protein [Cyanobacteria bacterium TGS_CYA1]|nr:VOC family protein [Cyanobacteria bacterium TGS_CYA1]